VTTSTSHDHKKWRGEQAERVYRTTMNKKTNQMHNRLKIIKTLLYSYSALHVSGTLVPILRSLVGFLFVVVIADARNHEPEIYKTATNRNDKYLLTPWSRVLLEKLTSKLCS
jgi:hypothetical protein